MKVESCGLAGWLRQSWPAAVLLIFLCAAAGATVITEDASITGAYLQLVVTPNDGAVISRLSHAATAGDYAGEYGLLLEGFGVGNPYVPQVRSNETLEIDETVHDRAVLRYTYDCEGANIKNFHVVRTMEPLPNEASVRVRWRVENRGDEKQWVVPWVRNDVLPAGKFSPETRIDVPTLAGVRNIRRAGYYPASRNWIASTDPGKVTVYGVFNAEQTHSFLTLWDEHAPSAGFHTAFVPRLLDPGEAWETTYRINVVRGLKHVDFASSELAAQIEYEPGEIVVLLSAVKPLKDMEIHASVLAPNGRRWRLDPKKFSIDPNRLVRCTFEWTAPGDSRYDFLAELRPLGGERFVLSEEMATPHGGIDTQFVVGEPSGPATMPAWTDAPHVLDRGRRTLKRAVAAKKPVAVWAESSLEKIHPNDAVEPAGRLDNRIRMSLARNERESFQIVLRPDLEPLRNVDIMTGPMINRAANATLPAKNLSIYNVLFCPVQAPSFFEGPTGQWPDALPPFEPFDAPAGECRPIWFTVYVPPDTPPGLYTGTLVVKGDGLEPVEFSLELTVQDFQLPATPALKTDFLLGRPLENERLLEAYALNALEHRVTLRDYASLPEPGGDYEAKLLRFRSKIEPLLERGVSTLAVPASLLDEPDALKLAEKFVKQNKLGNAAFCHIANEPTPPTWPRLTEKMKAWIEAAEDIPMMITNDGFQPFLPSGVEIWAVHVPLLDTLNNKPVLEHIEQGKAVWLYVNHQVPRPYCNFLLDFSAVEHRMLFWQAWALGVEGVHYWAVAYTNGQNPYESLVDVTPVNGDGLLLYPGENGPVNSIRWENIRDGIEDCDYLAILMERYRTVAKKNPRHPALEQAAEALNIKKLVPDLVSFPRDPDQLMNKRADIARAIVALDRDK